MAERSARTVVAAAAAALAAALTWLPAPASAQDAPPPPPPLTLPPISIQLGPIGIDVAPITLLPGSPSTTAAPASSSSSVPATEPSVSDGVEEHRDTSGTAGGEGRPSPATVATVPSPADSDGADALTDSAPVSAARAVRQVADTFRFPLGLALAIVVFLLVQGQFDRRDRRLASIALDRREEYVSFR